MRIQFPRFRNVPRRQIWLIACGILLVALDELLRADFIPGRFGDAIALSRPILNNLTVVLVTCGAFELYFNRRKDLDEGTPVVNGATFLDPGVKDMCGRLDAWFFGENSSGSAERYAVFSELVATAKVYSCTDPRGMKVYFDDDGKTVIFKAGTERKHNLHELAHIYQQVSWKALTREYDGRITIPAYVRAEIEATWFAGQRVWTALWVAATLILLIGVVWYTTHLVMTALPPR